MFRNNLSQDILLNRLQSEVDYLREQNKQLLDRILALTNSALYDKVKVSESRDLEKKIQQEKISKMTPEDIRQEMKIAEEDKYKQNILNLQLGQMLQSVPTPVKGLV